MSPLRGSTDAWGVLVSPALTRWANELSPLRGLALPPYVFEKHDRIAWQEVAAMLAARCPQAVIEEALGREIASVMPELVRLAELRVRIPRYQVAMLAMLAERERLSVDELMARHFLDLAASEGEWLRRHLAGFDAAMRWPGE